jgi:hypothetical protein
MERIHPHLLTITWPKKKKNLIILCYVSYNLMHFQLLHLYFQNALSVSHFFVQKSQYSEIWYLRQNTEKESPQTCVL